MSEYLIATNEDMVLARRSALASQREAEAHNRRHLAKMETRFTQEGIMEAKVLSNLAEILVARYVGQRYHGPPPPYRPNGADVGTDIQVRHTKHIRGTMPLRPEDEPKKHMWWWLVRGVTPALEIVGFIRGTEGMVPEYWQADADPPYWKVPAYALSPAEAWHGSTFATRHGA